MQAYCSQTERHTSHSNCIICSRKHSVALNVHHGALAATSDDSPSHSACVISRHAPTGVFSCGRQWERMVGSMSSLY